MRTGQVKVTTDPQAIGEQARQVDTAIQREFIQLAAFYRRCGIEFTIAEPERKRYVKACQVQAASDFRIAQPDPTWIDLILQAMTAATEQGSFDNSAARTIRAVKDPTSPASFDQVGFVDFVHAHSCSGADSMSCCIFSGPLRIITSYVYVR